MKPAVLRFVIAMTAFVAWLGYLLNLAVSTAHPIVLHEPQFLVSNLDVIASIPSIQPGDNLITVREVHWPEAERANLVGKQLKVTNLEKCKNDFRGADDLYILPLIPDGKDAYRVAPLPRSPGFAGGTGEAGRPRIYPVTRETRLELDRIQKPAAPHGPGV
jgi:hypothetical protein